MHALRAFRRLAKMICVGPEGVRSNSLTSRGFFEMQSFTQTQEHAAMDWVNLWQEVGGEDTLETFVRDMVTEPAGVQDAFFAHCQLRFERGRDGDNLAMLADALRDEIEHRHQLATC